MSNASESPVVPPESTAHFLEVLRTRESGWPARNDEALRRIHELAHTRMLPWALIGTWRSDRNLKQNHDAYLLVEERARAHSAVTMLLGHRMEHGSPTCEPWLVCLGLERDRLCDVIDGDVTTLQLWMDPIADVMHAVGGAASRELGSYHSGRIAQHVAEGVGARFVGFDDPLRPWLGAVSAAAGAGVDSLQRMRAPLKAWFCDLSVRFETPGVPGIPTGIPAIDDAGGLAPGELLVVAGPPGAGKTSLAMSAALLAAEAGVPTLCLSLAETSSQIVERLAIAKSGVSAKRLRRAEIDHGDMSALTEGASVMRELPLAVEDGIGTPMTVGSAREAVTAWRANVQGHRALVVVDYLQLLRGDDRVRGLLETARAAEVAVVVVAQLDDDEHRGDVRCEWHMLRGVATAMVVITPPVSNETHHRLELVKHRRGPSVRAKLLLDPATGVLRFASVG